MREQKVCGRPTRKKTPCTSNVSRVPRLHGDDIVAPACGWHLTADERAAFEAAQQQGEADRRTVPACHEWPAPKPGQTLLDWFPDLCAICGDRDGSVIDHCHRSGLVRGHLCPSCNWREGRSQLPEFITYRRRPPAVILGWTYRYNASNWTDGEPQQWVVDALGAVPADPAEAARYLAATAELSWTELVGRRDNPLKKMGL